MDHLEDSVYEDDLDKVNFLNFKIFRIFPGFSFLSGFSRACRKLKNMVGLICKFKVSKISSRILD